MKLPNPFKRNRKYLIYGTKKGRRILIGSIESTPENLAEDLEKYIAEKVEENPEIRECKHIVVVDLKDNREIKLGNPFYEPSEEEGTGGGRSRGSTDLDPQTIQNIVKATANIQNTIIQEALKGVGQGLRALISEVLGIAVDAVKNVREIAIQQPQQSQSQEEEGDIVEELAKEFIRNIFKPKPKQQVQQEGGENEPQAG